MMFGQWLFEQPTQTLESVVCGYEVVLVDGSAVGISGFRFSGKEVDALCERDFALQCEAALRDQSPHLLRDNVYTVSGVFNELHRFEKIVRRRIRTVASRINYYDFHPQHAIKLREVKFAYQKLAQTLGWLTEQLREAHCTFPVGCSIDQALIEAARGYFHRSLEDKVALVTRDQDIAYLMYKDYFNAHPLIQEVVDHGIHVFYVSRKNPLLTKKVTLSRYQDAPKTRYEPEQLEAR